MTPGWAGPIPEREVTVLTDRSLGAKLVLRFFGVALDLIAMASGGDALDEGETFSRNCPWA